MKQAEVIAKYLPEQLSGDKLEAEIKNIIAAVGASSLADLGKVMGTASKASNGNGLKSSCRKSRRQIDFGNGEENIVRFLIH